MTTVVFGSNRFIDCGTLVAFGSQPGLRVETAPLRVTLATPRNLPSGRTVNVVENELKPESLAQVKVIKSDTSVAVFWADSPLVIATQLDADVVSLRADLRPIGINLYDDADGLHVGSMHFKSSAFARAAVAFQLG